MLLERLPAHAPDDGNPEPAYALRSATGASFGQLDIEFLHGGPIIWVDRRELRRLLRYGARRRPAHQPSDKLEGAVDEQSDQGDPQ